MPPRTDSPSPAKKRRTGTTPVKRGIDFFFKKQLNQKYSAKPGSSAVGGSGLFVPSDDDETQRRRQQEEEDARLARQLQDMEDHNEAADAELARRLAEEDAVVSVAEPTNETSNHDQKENQSDLKETALDKTIQVSKLDLADANSTPSLEDIYAIPLDKDPLTFNPAIDAKVASKWSGGRTPYAFLTHAFILINSTRSRLKIVDYLVNTLRCVTHHDPRSLLPLVWLTTNAIAPPFQGIELNLGGSVMSKALKSASGLGEGKLKALYDKWGDIGDVAFEAKMSVRTLVAPPPLTVTGVYATLREIARAKGTGSAETKRRLVERLLVGAKGEEVRYIGRTLVQHVTFLRISGCLGWFFAEMRG
jgi:DNA ligase 1